MTKWRQPDPWADDDPAIVRGRVGLALRPVEAPTPPDASSGAPGGATRRERLAALVHRIEADDLSAIATLRELGRENR